MRRNWLVRFWYSFSTTGLLLGTLFFAASLTPTLIPRNYLTQGVLSGCAAAAGYGAGYFLRWLWRYLELPELKARILSVSKLAGIVACTVVGLVFLWRAAEWQNSIRSLMGLEPVDTAHPIEVGAIALITFVVLIALARLFNVTLHFVSGKLDRIAPTRVSYVLGATIVVLLFWSIASGVIFRYALRVADSSFRAARRPDAARNAATDRPRQDGQRRLAGQVGRILAAWAVPTLPPARPAPTSPVFTGKPALEPIRVYVGLHSGDTPQERAKLALRGAETGRRLRPFRCW